MEVEVRWNGSERGAGAEADGGQKPSSEAIGGGAQAAGRRAEGGDPKSGLPTSHNGSALTQVGGHFSELAQGSAHFSS
jgi:hypothetical protein